MIASNRGTTKRYQLQGAQQHCELKRLAHKTADAIVHYMLLLSNTYSNEALANLRRMCCTVRCAVFLTVLIET
jgi:hypothetical protein